MLRIPHGLDSRLTDGGEVVSPTHRPRSTLQKHYFSASGTHFCYRRSKPQGLVRPEGLGKLEKINLPHRLSNPPVPLQCLALQFYFCKEERFTVAHSSVVIKALLQAGRSWVRDPMR
jgi:hypothetical protein